MNVNATLFGQMISFALLTAFIAKFIWPPLIKILQEREIKIAEGLKFSQESKSLLEMVEKQVKSDLNAARLEAEHIILQAQKNASKILTDAQKEASKNKTAIINSGNQQIKQEILQVKHQLQKELAELVSLGIEKVLERKVDIQDQNHLLQTLMKSFNEN